MTQKRQGEFELAVLRAIANLGGNGYGVTIADKTGEFVGRDVSLGAVYATADRLQRKGFISSELGEATPERGGKPKRYYKIEAPGQRALDEGRAAAQRLWGAPVGALA
jgi:PadR family transcriptional regulator PadR